MADPNIDLLARPGGNDQVLVKKVLLAALARDELDRLAAEPSTEDVATFASGFLQQLELSDSASIGDWLAEAGLTQDEFEDVMCDFAAVLAVEEIREKSLAERLDRHRRVVAARTARLATTAR